MQKTLFRPPNLLPSQRDGWANDPLGIEWIWVPNTFRPRDKKGFGCFMGDKQTQASKENLVTARNRK